MVPHLLLRTGKLKGKEFPLREGTNLVGRWDPETGSFPEVDLDDADEDAKISRKHAAIKMSADELSIKDMGSLNGTFLNRGERLEPGKVYSLQEGDEIVIGKLFLRVVLTE